MHHRRSLRDLRASGTLAYGLVSLVILLCSPLSVQAEWTLFDGARVHPEYHGPVPKKSDVIFSTRFKRDNAADVARAYGATRIEWVYPTDPDFVRALAAVTPWFGGAVNSTMVLPTKDGLALDYDGNPIVPPWMKSWGAKSITTTHEDTKAFLKQTAVEYINLGADSIQIDDPMLQLFTAEWGGDFSVTTLSGFRDFLDKHPNKSELKGLGIHDIERFDYKTFLRKTFGVKTSLEYRRAYRTLPTTPLWMRYLKGTVQDHIVGFRKALNETVDGTFPVSMNLGILNRPDETNRHFFLSRYADYALAETPITDIDELVTRAATLQALGVGYAPSLKPKALLDNRKAIATFYALGAQPVVPWDVYVNNGPDVLPSRFFGLVDDHGDLYKFVRDHSWLFDELESSAMVGVVIPVDRYSERLTLPLIRRMTRNNVPFAFVLVGGIEQKYYVDTDRASKFRLLLMSNQVSDYSDNDRNTIAALGVKMIHGDKFSEEVARDLSPFITEGLSQSIRLYPRAYREPQGRTGLVIHVVDESKVGGHPKDERCETVVQLKSEALGGHKVKKAIWHSTGVTLNAIRENTEKGQLFRVASCNLWGVLELSTSDSES